jgi:NAD(P)-dependent dehydrogenase (short-subunit alcohol dehydrogenase family)
MFMKITDKRVLITGSAKRVGAALALAFAQQGAKVLLHYNHSRSEAETLLHTLPGSGHELFQADLSDAAAVKQLFAQAGKADILINNASRYLTGTLLDETPAKDREQLEVNFWAPLELMRSFAGQDIEEGVIINFVDQEVLKTPRNGIYSLSRRMLADATLELAAELGPLNIRVNAIAPGPVIPPPEFAANGMKKTLPTLPLRRKVELDDLTNAVLFLVGNRSITGAILPVDCGQHLV